MLGADVEELRVCMDGRHTLHVCMDGWHMLHVCMDGRHTLHVWVRMDALHVLWMCMMRSVLRVTRYTHGCTWMGLTLRCAARLCCVQEPCGSASHGCVTCGHACAVCVLCGAMYVCM